jgi:hypothetical protein
MGYSLSSLSCKKRYIQKKKEEGICLACGKKHDNGTFNCKECMRKQTEIQTQRRRELKCQIKKQ